MRRAWRFIRRQRFILALTPLVGVALLKLLYRSLRVIHRDRCHLEGCLSRGEQVIFAFWHGRMLMMPFAYPGLSLAILISHHRDGEYISRIVERLGFLPIRGSAARGGTAAFRKMVQAVRKGFHAVITPDGPRGPRGRVKPGIVELAKLTGCPILPVAFGAASCLFLKSWDAFVIPFPFSRSVYIWGKPLYVQPTADEAEVAKLRQVLEEQLQTLTMEADAFFRSAPKP